MTALYWNLDFDHVASDALCFIVVVIGRSDEITVRIKLIIRNDTDDALLTFSIFPDKLMELSVYFWANNRNC